MNLNRDTNENISQELNTGAMSSFARPVYHTAIAIVPPASSEASWAQLQQLREALRDKGFYRWPPHVNLLYPFVDVELFEEVAHALAAQLEFFPAFDIQLSNFGVFGGNKSGVCYLEPIPNRVSAVKDLYSQVALVMSRYMECAPAKQFTAHLTVAHTASRAAAEEAAAASASIWVPVSFHVGDLYILHRSPPHDQYRIAWKIPLGRPGGTPERADGVKFDMMPEVEPSWIQEIKSELSVNKRPNRKRGAKTGSEAPAVIVARGAVARASKEH